VVGSAKGIDVVRENAVAAAFFAAFSAAEDDW